MMIALSLSVGAMRAAPALTTTWRAPPSHLPRARRAVALQEFSAVADAIVNSGAVVADAVVNSGMAAMDAPMELNGAQLLPTDFFADIKPDVVPRPPTFSAMFLKAVGLYVSLQAVCTFAPLVKAKITGSKGPELTQKQIDAYLDSVSDSKFGWHNVDLRTPLPEVHELQTKPHPIGVRDGAQAYLATSADAHKFTRVERSNELSEHYGIRLYICYS
jgi:hypothetical protein